MSSSSHDRPHHITKNPLKKINTPTANELSESILLQTDIQSSFNAMRLWVERYSDKNDLSSSEQTISQSLFRDAVVQCIGCFDKTAEYSISPDNVYDKTDGGTEFFHWLKDIRDAYAAHKFGAMRQCIVGVIVDPSSSKILGVGHLNFLYMGPDKQGGREILRFMRIAVSYIDNLVEDNKTRLAKEAENLSSTELKKLPTGRVYGIGPKEVRMTRTKLQKSRTGKPPTAKDSS